MTEQPENELTQQTSYRYRWLAPGFGVAGGQGGDGQAGGKKNAFHRRPASGIGSRTPQAAPQRNTIEYNGSCASQIIRSMFMRVS